MGPWRMLLLPDHATPLRLKTHTSDPVPYLLYDSEVTGLGGEYSERFVAGSPVAAGHDLMAQLVGDRSPVDAAV
jgi:2,3-bisphosphoglycerate-independent phosphoglycerate mutase